MDVKRHIICDAINEGIVQVEYVRSRGQHADILTKALDVKTLEEHAVHITIRAKGYLVLNLLTPD